MIRIARTVKFQLLVFVAITLLGLSYTGAHFVGFAAFNPTYTVHVDLPSSGGIFTNAEVTYRGVQVGRVGKLTLLPNGVRADLHLDQGTKIPAGGIRAAVDNLSAVGEQYIELEPQTDAGPYLHAGSTIGLADTTVPVSDEAILVNLNNLVDSVNLSDLSTTISELGAAFAGTGPVLHQLIAAGDALTTAAAQNLPSNITLINDGKTVLDTQRAVAGDLQTFSANLASLSAQFVSSDSDLRTLFTTGTTSAQQLQQLFADNEQALPVLLGNLITVGSIQAARLPALRETLILYPGSVADGFLTTTSGGLAKFGLITTSNNPPCTNGYQGVPQRSGAGNNPSADYGGPANLNVDCNEPSNSTFDPRGARNAPRPAGDTTGIPTNHHYSTESFPYGGAQPSSNTSAAGAAPSAAGSGSTLALPYDAQSGTVVVPGSGVMTLGTTGGEQRLLGSNAWQFALLAPFAG